MGANDMAHTLFLRPIYYCTYNVENGLKKAKAKKCRSRERERGGGRFSYNSVMLGQIIDSSDLN